MKGSFSDSSDSYPDAANSYLIGVCTGLFAATAVSSSRTMTELVPAGVEAALVAFRTGLHSLKMQRDIEPLSANASRSWSFIFTLSESQALEVLQGFNAEVVSNLIQEIGSIKSLTSAASTAKLTTLCERCYSVERNDQWTSSRIGAPY